MRWTIPALLLLPLQACIYYDGQGDCDGDCWGDWDDTASSDDTAAPDDTGTPDTTDTDDTADTSDTSDTDDTCDPEDTADDPIPLSLHLDPGDATPCSTFIASLTDENGLFDLSDTRSAQFFGPAHVLALQARTDEVILSIAVDAEAVPGTIDLLVEFGDGTAAFADNALTIGAATTTLPADCICSDAL